MGTASKHLPWEMPGALQVIALMPLSRQSRGSDDGAEASRGPLLQPIIKPQIPPAFRLEKDLWPEIRCKVSRQDHLQSHTLLPSPEEECHLQVNLTKVATSGP